MVRETKDNSDGTIRDLACIMAKAPMISPADIYADVGPENDQPVSHVIRRVGVTAIGFDRLHSTIQCCGCTSWPYVSPLRCDKL
jgi:hypothetical protein